MNIPTSALLDYVPHRPPMVWIDEVLEYSPTSGRALLRLKSEGLYMNEGYLRSSAGIEILAQAYAYYKAALQRSENIPPGAQQKAFLATIKDFKTISWPSIAAGEQVIAEVFQGRHFGPITLIKGQIFYQDRVIASGELKVFSESVGAQ